MKPQRVLRRGQQPVALDRHGDAGRIVQMHHAHGVGARGMHGRVQREARHVDRMLAVADPVASQVDLHEIRRADFVEREAERVDQEVAGPPGTVADRCV